MPDRMPNKKCGALCWVQAALVMFLGSGSAIGADTTPDPFAFTNKTGVATGITVTSNVVTVSGITGPANLTLTGDASRTYSLNGGAYTAVAATVHAGDTIRLRMISAPSADTAIAATLNLGGVSAT